MMAIGKYSGRKPAGDAISEPKLTFTDAAPRSDLQTPFATNPAGLLVPDGRPVPERSRTDPNQQQASRPVERPPVRSRTRTDTGAPPVFDFGLTGSPDPRTLSPTHYENESIGLALGSPGFPKWDSNLRRGVAAPNDPHSFNTANIVDDEEEFRFEKVKTSKWKKIGGMFKAKQALSHQNSPVPFYQVQPNSSASPAYESEPISSEKTSKGRKRSNTKGSKGSGDARSDWDFLKTSPESSQGRGLRQRKDSGKAGLERFPAVPPRNITYDNGSPLLNVDIPDIQLERYSVMFQGLLTGKGDRRTILDRRSRILDQLNLPIDDCVSCYTEYHTNSTDHR